MNRIISLSSKHQNQLDYIYRLHNYELRHRFASSRLSTRSLLCAPNQTQRAHSSNVLALKAFYSVFEISKRSFSTAKGPGDSPTEAWSQYERKTPIEHVLLRPDSYVRFRVCKSLYCYIYYIFGVI